MISAERKVEFQNSIRNFLTKGTEQLNRQSTSILGNAIWGIPFVPTFINGNFNNGGNDILQSFETNYGNFIDNHKEFQAHILPYIAGYSVLETGAQLNYTRLAGLDLPDFPSLKPGFLLNNQHNLYLLSLNFNTRAINKNFFNFENAGNNTQYQAIILTKNCSLNLTVLNNGKLSLNIVGLNNSTQIVNEDSPGQKNFQDKIFFTQPTNLPPRNITFDFNIDSDFYWKEVLNTNIHRLNDFGYALIHYDDIFNKINFEENHITNNTVTLTLLNNNNLKTFQEAYHHAQTPWIVSQGFYNNQNLNTRSESGLHLKDRVIKLFKIHALSPGKLGNQYGIKIIPDSLTESAGWARFHLHLINKKNENVIYEFNNLDLNPDSSNFIGKVIGTQATYFDVATRKITHNYIEHSSQNPWIRVELSDHVMNKSILQESIPAGFLGHNKLKSDLIPNLNILNKNYVVTPQFENISSNNFENINLLKSHAWGDNLKNVRIKKIKFEKIFFKSVVEEQNLIKERKNNDSFSVLEYYHKNLHLNRGINQTEYLNVNFYDNYDIDNYDDMFHLEKILLLNKYDELKTIQYWQLARYLQSGQNIDSITDNKFWEGLFENNTDIENLFYYFIISKKGFISPRIDTISEVKRFSDINILSFNIEMTGGWDGLNLLDLDEYCINNRGLEKSAYLRELYKIGLEIIHDESNCLSDFIYLPEIFNTEIIEHASILAADNPYSILLLDQPFYNNSNNIVYGRDFLKLDAGESELQYTWSDQKYIYLNQTLNFNNNNTINNWNQNYNQISNITSFGNYALFKLLSGIEKRINILGPEQTIITPAGLLALSALTSFDNIALKRQMNPIHNININGLGDLTIFDVLESFVNHDDLTREKYVALINNLNINVLYADRKNSQTTYTFYSDKTHQFSNSNNSILSKLNVRNTLNHIKKTIKWASYSQLFSKIDNIQNVTNRLNLIYSIILTNYQNIGLITNFKIMLDNKTTSNEDLLIGLVRGSIYVQFNNQEIAQVNV